MCAKKRGNVQVEMTGKPNSTALYKKIQAHEQQHVTDLQNLTTKVLKPYHDFLVGLTGTGKTGQECVDDIFKQVGKRDTETTRKFVDDWLAAVQVYDKPGGSHHSKFATHVDQNCTKMDIKETR